MDYHPYLEEFQSALKKVDKNGFDKSGIKLFTGIVLNSAVIKAYKPEWSNDLQNALTATSRIFFSVWVNEKTISEHKLYYNIHALKLRKLNGYKIQSRGFAERFRLQFKPHQKNWPNVSTQYGPLTLMEGWEELKEGTIQKDIIMLIQKFLIISPIIDNVLDHYRLP